MDWWELWQNTNKYYILCTLHFSCFKVRWKIMKSSLLPVFWAFFSLYLSQFNPMGCKRGSSGAYHICDPLIICQVFQYISYMLTNYIYWLRYEVTSPWVHSCSLFNIWTTTSLAIKKKKFCIFNVIPTGWWVENQQSVLKGMTVFLK